MCHLHFRRKHAFDHFVFPLVQFDHQFNCVINYVWQTMLLSVEVMMGLNLHHKKRSYYLHMTFLKTKWYLLVFLLLYGVCLHINYMYKGDKKLLNTRAVLKKHSILETTNVTNSKEYYLIAFSFYLQNIQTNSL